MGDALNHSFDDMMIHIQGLPYLEEEVPQELEVLAARDVMSAPVIQLPEKVRVAQLLATLRNSPHNGFPIVGSKLETMHFTSGLVLRQQLEASSAVASSASPPPSSLDSAQAERCSAGRGAGARAIETYAFGNVLYFACYGHVRRTVSWSKYSCDLPRPGLLELQLTHTKDQPTGPADAEARFNRCASMLQSQLDDLMRYCWQPTLEAAEALLRPAVAQHPSNRPANFSWEVVIGQLQAMHRIGTGRRPLFRFM